MQQFICGKVRVQILSANVVRIERAIDGKFCDENTFFAPNRKDIAKQDGQGVRLVAIQKDNEIIFGDYKLIIANPSLGLDETTLTYCGEVVYRYQDIVNSGELPKPIDTPIVFPISDSPRIIQPKRGYTVHQEDCSYQILEKVQDVYLLLCQRDHKKLRQLYVSLTGRCELVRLSTLGNWNSKYFPYNQQQAMQVILDYQRYGIPLDNIVIDTDWRTSKNGWGYDVNTDLFPDLEAFFQFAHSNGVEVMFNDHPEPYQNSHVFERGEIDYRESNLQRLLQMGLDIWWYDRNWMTHLISPTNNVAWETFGMYLFYQITKNYYQKITKEGSFPRRSVIMANVSNIVNGSYQAITDSASHRYSIQWTGDCMSDAGALGQEIANVIRAGENCVGYVHPDCGGHLGNPDDKLFVRWMQMGALCPVLRPHCTCNVQRFREPWLYGEKALNITREYVNLRYRLLPTIYAQAYQNYQFGWPIFASLGFNYPQDEIASNCLNEYMLGKNILIAPICGEFPQKVPDCCYVEPVVAQFFDGRECRGEVLASITLDNLSMQLNHSSPADDVPIYDFSAKFSTSIKFADKVKLILRCDDGATVKIDDKIVLRDDTLHGAKNFDLAILEANVTHRVEIEYFQAGGEAACILMYQKVAEQEGKVYLPQDKWINLFDGRRYSNGFVNCNCDERQMPLFVRSGAVVPVAIDGCNAKQQLWDQLTYHYYADRRATDEGFLYEDDGETIAYQQGYCRTSKYQAFYDNGSKTYNLRLSKAVGCFEGPRAFTSRKINVVAHIPEGEEIIAVTLNGVSTKYKIIPQTPSAMPFTFNGESCDGQTVKVTFDADVYQDYSVAFYTNK